MNNTIDDLYFGIKYWEFNGKRLVEANLFDCGRIRWCVARYITIVNDKKKADLYDINDPLLFIFGDVWSRYEWEFYVCDPREDGGEKQSVYDMFVKPNRDILMGLVNGVSLKDAKKYIKEYK